MPQGPSEKSEHHAERGFVPGMGRAMRWYIRAIRGKRGIFKWFPRDYIVCKKPRLALLSGISEQRDKESEDYITMGDGR